MLWRQWRRGKFKIIGVIYYGISRRFFYFAFKLQCFLLNVFLALSLFAPVFTSFLSWFFSSPLDDNLIMLIRLYAFSHLTWFCYNHSQPSIIWFHLNSFILHFHLFTSISFFTWRGKFHRLRHFCVWEINDYFALNVEKKRFCGFVLRGETFPQQLIKFFIIFLIH